MAPSPHVPTIDELLELPQPDDARISPDGTYVAYVVSKPDWKENEYVSQIWLVSADEPEPRQLTFAAQSSTSPRWSPDGRWLAFLSKRKDDEHTQIYRISPFGGEAERLTEVETDVQALAWSPDGAAIAYVAAEPESAAEKQREEKYGKYHVEDQDYRRAQLWLLQLEARKCRKLTGGDDLHVVDLDWNTRGGQIAFEAWPAPDLKDFVHSRVYRLDLATLELTALTGERHGTPRWSPDGEYIACRRDGEWFHQNTEIGILPAGGGEMRVISERFDEEVWLQDWGTAGIYFAAVQRTATALFRIDPQGGDYAQVSPPDVAGWAALDYTFSQDFTRAAAVGADADHCAEVTLLDLDAGGIRRLTDLNARTQEWQLSRHEVFAWTSRDGTPIEGILTRPADFDPAKRYPLLVVIHGGPSWSSLQARLLIDERRYYPIQQWAAKGALVLQPNYRGSIGYGQAFHSLNVRNMGVGDYEDVISGVEALIERGWADPDRLGAMGWSQGGYISAFITTYSDRFKAISVGAGIANWVTYYVNTDIHPFTRHYLQATPWEDAEIYQKTSPITYVRQARTPTLIQHGEFDRRVPIANAYELYQGLQDAGVEVKLVVYKDMPHGITKPRLNRQVIQENWDWFNRWIWGEEPAAREKAPCYVALDLGEQCPDEADLPAIERYRAEHVEDVRQWARRDRAEWRLFSARLGLLQAEDPVPPYEHRLRGEEVSAMAGRLAEQIRAQGLRKLVLYTEDAEKEPAVLIYLGCLQVAAGMVGEVTVEHRKLADESDNAVEQG